jgi:hypothetical protein
VELRGTAADIERQDDEGCFFTGLHFGDACHQILRISRIAGNLSFHSVNISSSEAWREGAPKFKQTDCQIARYTG